MPTLYPAKPSTFGSSLSVAAQLEMWGVSERARFRGLYAMDPRFGLLCFGILSSLQKSITVANGIEIRRSFLHVTHRTVTPFLVENKCLKRYRDNCPKRLVA